MELDHIYICTGKNAPAADALVDFGITEGSPNVHPGQGTACRRFFFHNFMLELLWGENIAEMTSENTKPLLLYEKCVLRPDDISPFGMGFRKTDETGNAAPFPARAYHPAYLPDSLNVQVADGTKSTEPMYFYLFFAARQDSGESKKNPEPMAHRIPMRELTSATVFAKQQSPISRAARIINRTTNVEIKSADENLLILGFDNGTRRGQNDFRPHLPLVMRW
ncbi:MAG: hypothetical protein LBB66_00660 [Desulfovibrio sp.]|jgi:hypothetical protein|nr:hypothetical protein [Desulfovibrio sp.]